MGLVGYRASAASALVHAAETSTHRKQLTAKDAKDAKEFISKTSSIKGWTRNGVLLFD
jgi:hypothetical protein